MGIGGWCGGGGGGMTANTTTKSFLASYTILSITECNFLGQSQADPDQPPPGDHTAGGNQQLLWRKEGGGGGTWESFSHENHSLH